eukprot:scpid35292/ scgid24889/ 
MSKLLHCSTTPLYSPKRHAVCATTVQPTHLDSTNTLSTNAAAAAVVMLVTDYVQGLCIAHSQQQTKWTLEHLHRALLATQLHQGCEVEMPWPTVHSKLLQLLETSCQNKVSVVVDRGCLLGIVIIRHLKHNTMSGNNSAER